MTRSRDWLRETPWLAAFVPLALAYTWPLVAQFGSALAGNGGDPWQNLWNIEWLHRSLGSGTNPLFTRELWHPDGVTLIYQTFDLPDSLWGAALIRVLGPWPTYNMVVLATFVMSGWAMYALGRGLGASRPASFLSGCAFTFSTYHFAHALAHLHLLSMEWVPLFALAWWRVLERSSWRSAVVGGICLGLSSLASWYYLLGGALIAAGTGLVWLIRTRGRDIAKAVSRVALLALVTLAMVGPLMLGIARASRTDPVNGAHLGEFYSADAQSFFLPNAAQALTRLSDAYERWTGNPGENGTYLGYALLALALTGLALRAPRVGAWLVAAVLGVVLSLGSRLHWGGQMITGEVLPYAFLERGLPMLRMSSVPVRLAFAATFALSAALAPALDALAQRVRWPFVALAGIVAVAEHLPQPLTMTAFPTPAPMREWTRDSSDFAVLDACADSLQLWHQVVHGHPIMGGYVTRVPSRLSQMLGADPIAGPLMAKQYELAPWLQSRVMPFTREAGLDHLRELHIRYIVLPTSAPPRVIEVQQHIVETQLGLHPFYEGEEVRLYEVPAR